MDTILKDRLFALAEHYVEDTVVSLFLTGKAGTGKTTFLRYITENTSKRFVVLAPTGVAAVAAHGTTIHSFFSLPLCPYLPDVPSLRTEYQMPDRYRRLRKDKVKIIRTLDLLIIDEVSMVRADLMDAVDMTLRRYRRSSKPFGGVQLLLIGDAQQLSPVVTEKERPYIEQVYPSPYFFHSKALRQVPYATIELQEIYRQSDKAFIGILNGIRDASVTPDMLRALNARLHAPAGDDWIRLTTHNYQADSINAQRMDALPGEPEVYDAWVDGDYPESLYPAAESLSVKPGARMMFIRNDPDGRFYNGKLGTVTATTPQTIELQTDDGESIVAVPAEWENLQYTLDDATGEIVQEVKGTFRQFPLRPAWAITIHKSQGLTFDHVIIDAGAAFAFGQVYVALSRCRSLEGISLESPISASLLYADADVSAFNRSFPDSKEVESALGGHVAAARLELMCECFRFDGLLRGLYSLRKLWRDSLSSLYPTQTQELEDAVRVLADAEDVAGRFRRQLETLQSDAAMTAERISKACEYFLPRLEGLGLDSLLGVEVDNSEVRGRLRNLSADILPLWKVHLRTLRGVLEDGFDPLRFRQLRTGALLEDGRSVRPSRKPSGSKAAAEEPAAERDIYKDNRHPELAAELSAWRRKKAQQMGVQAYQVMHQRTLLGIADAAPSDREGMLEVHGFGPRMWEKFGEELLEVLAGGFQAEPEKETASEKSESRRVSLELYQEGLDISGIAARRELTEETVWRHLLTYLATGEVDICDLVSGDVQQQVCSYFESHPGETSLTPCYDFFGGAVSYNEIRAVRLWCRQRAGNCTVGSE